jgi:hypothetical protein
MGHAHREVFCFSFRIFSKTIVQTRSRKPLTETVLTKGGATSPLLGE